MEIGPKRYAPPRFESTIKPSVIWVDLDKVDLAAGARVVTLDVARDGRNGEVSAEYQAAEPFEFMTA